MANDIPLLYLVADLMRDPELRQRFNQNPGRVMNDARYGLDASQQDALMTMDKGIIGQALYTLFNLYDFPAGEFQPLSEDFFAEDGGIDPAYPDPKPGIFRFRPLAVSAAAVNTDKKFEIAVFGQSFHKKSQLALRRTNTPGAAEFSFHHVIGTFRCSTVRAVVTPARVPGAPSPEGKFNPGDTFDVVVVNPEPHSAFKPPGFGGGLQEFKAAKPLVIKA